MPSGPEPVEGPHALDLAPCTFPAFLAFLYRSPFTIHDCNGFNDFNDLSDAMRYAITSRPTHREEFYSGAERIRALNTLS